MGNKCSALPTLRPLGQLKLSKFGPDEFVTDLSLIFNAAVTTQIVSQQPVKVSTPLLTR